MKQSMETVEIDGWTFYAGPWGTWVTPVVTPPESVPGDTPDPRRKVSLVERRPEWPTIDAEGRILSQRSGERWPVLRVQDKDTAQRLLIFTTLAGGALTRNWFLETEEPQDFAKEIEQTGDPNDPHYRKGKYEMRKSKKSATPKPAAKAAKKAKSATTAKAKPERASKARTPRRAKVFDRYNVNGVLLLMGAKGFTVEDAAAFLKSEKLEVSPITITTRISTGRRTAAGEKGVADRGEPAKVSREDWAKIAEFKGKGGEPAKAKRKAKAEPKPKAAKKPKPAKAAKVKKPRAPKPAAAEEVATPAPEVPAE